MKQQLPEFNEDSLSLKTILSVLGEGAYMVDRERRIVFWNRSAEKLTGYLASDVIGFKCSANILRHVTAEGVELCTNGCPLLATMRDGATREAEVYLHHVNGHRLPVFVRSAPLHDEGGKIAGSLEIFSDKSDRSTLLAELEILRKENLTDPFTGLGNRRYLELVSETRFASLGESEIGFGLLIADIDHFKAVNDGYGHLNGDKVLAMIANTILGAIRPADSAIRFGGDEFIVLCPNCGIKELSKVAERIRTLVKHAWLDIGPEGRLSVTLSIGGSVVSRSDDLASLIAKADARLFECKEAGRDNCLVSL